MINLSQELTDADYSQKVTSPRDDADTFRVPEKIGKYEVCELLGKGTCGVVHRGFDPFVQRNVAIKIARTREDPKGSTGSAAQTFFTEAHAAGKLQHPHIVSLFDAGLEGQFNYIVMEYLEGETLENYTRGGKRLAAEKVIDVIYKCCKALDYSHAQGIVHRDIKPTNVMITKGGDVKIMDFSIALMNANRAPGERSSGGAVGTPGYMSPEQVLSKTTGPTSDLYSLAVVMFEMLAGHRLFSAKTMRELFVSIIREPAPKLSSVRPDLPPELSQVLEKALRKKPSDRFQTGQEFAIALNRTFDRLRLSEKHASRSENRNMLQNLNFFNGFTDNEIDEILDASHLIQFKQGETIINEGEVDNAFFIVVVGSAVVIKSGVQLDTLREGDCFGEIGFLMQTKRTATVTASSDMLVLKVNELLMDQVPQETQLHYYKAFVETLVYRLSVTSARLTALRAAQNPPERVSQSGPRKAVEVTAQAAPAGAPSADEMPDESAELDATTPPAETTLPTQQLPASIEKATTPTERMPAPGDAADEPLATTEDATAPTQQIQMPTEPVNVLVDEPASNGDSSATQRIPEMETGAKAEDDAAAETAEASAIDDTIPASPDATDERNLDFDFDTTLSEEQQSRQPGPST